MADQLYEGVFGEKYIKHDDGTESYVREGVLGHRWIEHPDKTWSEIRKGVTGEYLEHSDGSVSYRREAALGGHYFDHGGGHESREFEGSLGTPYLQHSEEQPSYFHRSGFGALFEDADEIPPGGSDTEELEEDVSEDETENEIAPAHSVRSDYSGSSVTRTPKKERRWLRASGNLLAGLAVIGGMTAAIVVLVHFGVAGEAETQSWLRDLKDRFWNLSDDPVINFLVNAGVVAVTLWVGVCLVVVTLAFAVLAVVIWLLAQTPTAVAWLIDWSPIGAAIVGVVALWLIWRFGVRRLVALSSRKRR